MIANLIRGTAKSRMVYNTEMTNALPYNPKRGDPVVARRNPLADDGYERGIKTNERRIHQLGLN